MFFFNHIYIGDHIQGAFNISRTPLYCLNNHNQSKHRRRQTRQSSSALLLRNPLLNAKQQQQQRKSMPLLLEKRSKLLQDQQSTISGDCQELQKLRSTAIYFLHNKERTRSYYNLDVRYPNGTQRRVRSRDLPWNMKQVCVKMLMRIHFQLVLKIFLSFGFFFV